MRGSQLPAVGQPDSGAAASAGVVSQQTTGQPAAVGPRTSTGARTGAHVAVVGLTMCTSPDRVSNASRALAHAPFRRASVEPSGQGMEADARMSAPRAAAPNEGSSSSITACHSRRAARPRWETWRCSAARTMRMRRGWSSRWPSNRPRRSSRLGRFQVEPGRLPPEEVDRAAEHSGARGLDTRPRNSPAATADAAGPSRREPCSPVRA